MDDTNNPDSYTIGNTVGDGTDTTSTVKAAADSAVGSNSTTAQKGSNTGPDTIKVRVGTGALYTEDTPAKVTGAPRTLSANSDATCQDCLNQIQVGVAGSGASIYARRENNVLLFKSLQVEGALTLRNESGTLILGGSAAVPALDVVLSSKGALGAARNKFLAVNDAGDGIAYVDAPTSTGGASKFSELTDVPALDTNVGRVLTVNNTGTGVVWTTLGQFDGKYSSLTGKPVLFDGTYAALTGKPVLFSGSYLDLRDRPVISSFDGAYASLSGKPTLVTQFAQLSDAPALAGNIGKVLTVGSSGALEWATVSTGSVTWASITGKPTLATVATSGAYADLSGKPSLFDGTYAALTGKPTLFDGTYVSLSGKPTIPTAPTKITDLDVPAYTLANANKVLAQNSSGNGVVWVSATSGATKLSQLTDVPPMSTNPNKVLAVNSAGTAYVWVDAGSGSGATKFSELSDAPAFATNQSKYLRLNGTGLALEFANITWAEILNKPSLSTVATTGLYSDLISKPTLASVATTGSYSDLTNKPTIATKLTQLSDTPLTSGNAGRVLAVNSGETGFEWVNLPTGSGGTGGATKFTGLSDVPSSYASAGGKTVRVNSAATALEFVASTLVGHTDFPSTYASQGGKGLRVNAAGNAVEFYAIATGFSGSYTDLTNKPTFATVATSGVYTDLTGRPTLATVATSGSYADLLNRPTLFSGSYTDLTNKPVIFSGAYADLTGKPVLATVATSGSYADLSNKPTIPTKVTDLDVPAYSSANANKVLAQNSAGTGLVWVALPTGGSGGATALTGLSDVAIASPTSGQVLTYNGTKWANAAAPSGSGGGGGSSNVYTFDINFGSDSKMLSVSNLPAGWTWNGTITNSTTATIVRTVSGFFSAAMGYGATVNGGTKFKQFPIGAGVASYITYDTSSPTSFDITITSAAGGNTVATGKTTVVVTL